MYVNFLMQSAAFHSIFSPFFPIYLARLNDKGTIQ